MLHRQVLSSRKGRDADGRADGSLPRRLFIRGAGAGVLGLGLVAAAPAVANAAVKSGGPGAGGPVSGLLADGAMTGGATSDGATSGSSLPVDAGVGMYTDQTVAFQMSTATINPQQVSCGVGTFGLDLSTFTKLLPVIGSLPGNVPVVDGSTGPFAMLMYSFNVTSYVINRATGLITARGTLRSITDLAGTTLEDVNSPYLAFGQAARNGNRPSFSIHFKTPFWTAPNNPLATPSSAVPGWSMFGGEFLVGTVNVTP